MFKGKRILVTGACGTVGSELIRQFASDKSHQPVEIVGIDNDENALFFQDQDYIHDSRVNFSFCDVRDRTTLYNVMEGIDVVFHTAALKHVVMMERSPDQAVQTNINGVQNVIHAAQQRDVERVIFTSSDKAVNPTNVMGTSKLMGERLMTAANSNRNRSRTIFAATRFGNVLGSNGSVFPIFKKQIENGGPITITDMEMTRFVMSIEESVRLVIDSAKQARGGEIFITKMPVVKICDLAIAMADLFGAQFGKSSADYEIKVIGTKPGEKLYEELMSHEETRRAVELEKYFSVMPAFRGIYHDISYNYDSIVSERVDDPYNSSHQKVLNVTEIKSLLRQYNLVETNRGSTTPDKRYWPGDKESARSANKSVVDTKDVSVAAFSIE